MAASRKRSKTVPELKEDDFKRIGGDIMGRSWDGCFNAFDERFLSFFGVSAFVCTLLWRMFEIDEAHYAEDAGAEPCHLLWALLFLKVYSTSNTLCKLVGQDGQSVDPKTFRKWSWLFVRKIACLHVDVVS